MDGLLIGLVCMTGFVAGYFVGQWRESNYWHDLEIKRAERKR